MEHRGPGRGGASVTHVRRTWRRALRAVALLPLLRWAQTCISRSRADRIVDIRGAARRPACAERSPPPPPLQSAPPRLLSREPDAPIPASYKDLSHLRKPRGWSHSFGLTTPVPVKPFGVDLTRLQLMQVVQRGVVMVLVRLPRCASLLPGGGRRPQGRAAAACPAAGVMHGGWWLPRFRNINTAAYHRLDP